MRAIEWHLFHQNRPFSVRDIQGEPNRPLPPHQLTYSRKPTSNSLSTILSFLTNIVRIDDRGLFIWSDVVWFAANVFKSRGVEVEKYQRGLLVCVYLKPLAGRGHWSRIPVPRSTGTFDGLEKLQTLPTIIEWTMAMENYGTWTWGHAWPQVHVP